MESVNALTHFPPEIVVYIIHDIKANKSRCNSMKAWRTFKDKYSCFPYNYYCEVYHIIRNNIDNFNLSSFEIQAKNHDEQCQRWIEKLTDIISSFENDEDGYSLKILLITILNEFVCLGIQNRFYLNLFEKYNTLWWEFKTPLLRTVPNFYKAFIQLNNYGFYKIKNYEDNGSRKLKIKHKIWKKEDLIDHVDYGYLDQSLFELMFDDQFRNRIKDLLISLL